MFEPISVVWSWWKNKSLFKKILWFLPILVIIVVAFCVCLFIRKDVEMLEELTNQSKKEKDKHEEFYEKHMQKVEEKNHEITEKINEERKKRVQLKEKKALRELKTRKKHEAIRRATTFDDIDRILDKDSRSRKPRRR